MLLPGRRRTAHDLRRTSATLMESLGISGDVIDECLDHMIVSRVRNASIRYRRALELRVRSMRWRQLLEPVKSGVNQSARAEQRHHAGGNVVGLNHRSTEA
jgi:hypothetical protein